MSCSNNLRQQGLALHNHHDSRGSLPAGVIVRDVDWISNANSALLPYLEQGNLQGLVDQQEPIWKAPPEVARTKLAIFSCPSDSSSLFTLPYSPGPIGKEHATSSYGHSKGVNDALCKLRLREPWAHTFGVFNVNSTIRFAEIHDGTTSTIAIGEAASGKPVCHGVGCDAPHPVHGAEHGWLMGPYNLPSIHQGSGFVYSGMFCSTVEPLNKPVTTDSMFAPRGWSDCRGSLDDGPHWVSNFRSFHQGGGFFLMADGSVQFIPDTIDTRTYRALSTIQGADIALLD